MGPRGRVRSRRDERGAGAVGLLVGTEVGDGAVWHLAVAPLVGDLVAPASKLGVEVVEVAEGPGGEEGMRQVLDLSSDFPLVVPASRRPGVQGRGAKRQCPASSRFRPPITSR